MRSDDDLSVTAQHEHPDIADLRADLDRIRNDCDALGRRLTVRWRESDQQRAEAERLRSHLEDAHNALSAIDNAMPPDRGPQRPRSREAILADIVRRAQAHIAEAARLRAAPETLDPATDPELEPSAYAGPLRWARRHGWRPIDPRSRRRDGEYRWVNTAGTHMATIDVGGVVQILRTTRDGWTIDAQVRVGSARQAVDALAFLGMIPSRYLTGPLRSDEDGTHHTRTDR